MTNVFTDTPVYPGWLGGYARVKVIDDGVLIIAADAMAGEAVIISMRPDQARALAQGIIEAADRAEGKQ